MKPIPRRSGPELGPLTSQPVGCKSRSFAPIGAVLMLILAFWTGGQLYITKACTLIVFAGIWALMQGITDLVRAFQVRRLRDV